MKSHSRKRTKSRLARKQLAYILLVSSIITLIGTGIQMYLEYQRDVSQIHDQIAQVLTGHLDSLTSSLWRLDDHQIEIELRNVLRMRDVVYIAIKEHDKVSYHAGQIVNAKRVIHYNFPMIFNDFHLSENIGTLHVVITFGGIYQRMRDRMLVILVTQGVKTFIVSFFILGIIYHLVTRHLIAIARYVQQLSPATPALPLTLDRPASPEEKQDELDLLITAINEMQQRLLQEIASQKQTEASLRESEEKYRQLFEVAQEGIWIIDAEAYTTFVNPSMAKILGYTIEEMQGRHLFSFMDERGVEIAQQNLDRRRKGIHEQHDFEFIRKDRSRVFTLIETAPILDNDGTYRGAIAGVIDITKRKQAEEALDAYKTHLEEIVKLRTVELEMTNKELRNFAYVVSHDLKAPLRGISRLADWFGADYADLVDEEGQQMIKLLIGRVKRMDDLIEGILEYSRIGRIVPEGERINVNTLVKGIIELLAPPETIQIIMKDELPEITGDKIRIGQVFQNLLSNAVKFIDKSEGTVIIGCVDKGTHWMFSIADNGPGIEGKYHEKIFQIFQTLAPRDDRESTGIGLSIVKKIIELHGGTIWVESVPGEGCTFYFTLPRKPTANPH